ncbi:MAG: PIN domain-containing protein [Pseudonocardiaceae bacterium]|nr:PIN domain-containing protein [Pseudonocardiaceae bacterium]
MTNPDPIAHRRGLLDTSVFIASESGRRLDEDRLPEESAISVVTLAELHAGVLAAPDTDTRAVRMATLDALSDVETLPVDEQAALAWARMRVHLADTGRRAGVNDLWIAACAIAHRLPIVTQDDDFDRLDGLAGLTIVRV